jgi:hypothetical protein
VLTVVVSEEIAPIDWSQSCEVVEHLAMVAAKTLVAVDTVASAAADVVEGLE